MESSHENENLSQRVLVVMVVCVVCVVEGEGGCEMLDNHTNPSGSPGKTKIK